MNEKGCSTGSCGQPSWDHKGSEAEGVIAEEAGVGDGGREGERERNRK